MNYSKCESMLFSVLCCFFLCCGSGQLKYSRIDYIIPGHIIISSDELQQAIGEIRTDTASVISLTVVIYSYSSGRETISFSGGDEMKTASSKGKIKALLKYTEGKKIVRAEFVEAEGRTREELISALAEKIRVKIKPAD